MWCGKIGKPDKPLMWDELLYNTVYHQIIGFVDFIWFYGDCVCVLLVSHTTELNETNMAIRGYPCLQLQLSPATPQKIVSSQVLFMV